MFKIVDPATYESYFQEMATGETGHIELKDFYCGESSEIIQATLSELQYPCLWLEDPSIRFGGVGRDGETCGFNGAIIILWNCPLDDFLLRRELKQKCFLIAVDILGRMVKDMQERELNLDPDSVSGDVISSMLVDGATGWRFEFYIKDPVAICYDSNKFKS